MWCTLCKGMGVIIRAHPCLHLLYNVWLVKCTDDISHQTPHLCMWWMPVSRGGYPESKNQPGFWLKVAV